jgi:hypothetical protein
VAEELRCAYCHAGVVDREDRVENWLRDGGWIVATSALGTGVDFLGVVYIVHVHMPWTVIDLAQEGGRGGRAGEVEREMQRNSDDVDVQAMGTFLLGQGCRRGLLSSYLDGRRIECSDIDAARCDRRGEGAGEWEESQRETSGEWQAVQGLLDEVREGEGCGICVMLEEGSAEAWREHKVMLCPGLWGLDGQEVDRFRGMIVDGGGGHSCRRCWMIRKFCTTGRDVAKPCQWPNVVVPVVRAVAIEPQGRAIARACGFQGDCGPNWREYAQWLGRRHSHRVWGEVFSNVVNALRILIYPVQQAGCLPQTG